MEITVNRILTLPFERIENFGLPRAWQVYGLLLCGQAGSILSIIWLNYNHISRLGIMLHVMMLPVLVVVLYLLFRLVSKLTKISNSAIALTTGLVKFLLIAFYLANWISFYFMNAPLNFDLVSSHFFQADPLGRASGLSVPVVSIFAAMLLLSCIALCFWLFRGAEDEKRHPWFLVTFLLLILSTFSLVESKQAQKEIIHSFFNAKERPVFLAPRGLLSFEKPPLEAVYANEHSKQVIARPLILISVDALRSDAMQIYGNSTPNTPFLNTLFDQGDLHRFDNAKTVCSNSYCGLIGMLASRYWSQMDRTPDNLADALSDNGYKSYFYLSGIHSGYHHLDLQYGTNVHSYKDGSSPGTENPNDDRNLLRWLNATQLEDEDRSFLWFHLMGVHGIGLRFTDGQVQVADPSVRDQTIIRNRTVGEFVQRYHDGIRQSDDTIRDIFSWLEKEGLLERAVVIITSDHGESLGEHGRLDHGGPLWKELTSVPLLVYDRQFKKSSARSVYSTVDIAPTFLEIIGAPIPLNWAGVPLQLPTERCAVPVEKFGSRVLVGEVAGKKVKYWKVKKSSHRGKDRVGEWLSFPDDSPERLKPITSDSDRALVSNLRDCFVEPAFVEGP
ncbi:MAG: glucan phosphoethanolaminetransferase (alkaline phosphatase superfamily) [Arenicella sp.]|jgi:glucan phosphoethanolaminetransferase (alkaline phosphatase superfamily)